MTMADRKMDKAIGLLNRVKIKCVNNLNVMEYNHEKFGVKNASDFEKIWGEYCKEKEICREYRTVEFLLRTIDQNAEKV